MRRRLARALVGVATLGIVAAGVTYAVRPRPPRNVVLICLDTVRFDAFFLRDQKRVLDTFSPWLRRGVNFVDAQSVAPWTIPTVATVMTGLYPPQHGAGRFPNPIANLDADTPSAMAGEITALGEILGAQNYETVAFYDNRIIDPVQGVLQGFGSVSFQPSRNIPAFAGQWLDARDGARPFFLYLHLMRAHDDHMASLEAVRATAGALSPVVRSAGIPGAPGNICAVDSDPGCLRYLAYLHAIDLERAAVARILNRLQKHDLLKDTVVVLFSDHGEEFGEHRATEAGLNADPRASDGTGHGHSLYQSLLHVPLIVWHPGFEGRTIKAAVSLVDVAPTIAEWLGVNWRLPEWPGRSLARINRLEHDHDLAARVRFSTGIAYGAEQFAGVQDAFKRIETLDRMRSVAFDLRADPREQSPLPDAQVQRLAGSIAAFRQLNPLGKSVPPQMDAERLQALRSIGYLGGAAPAAGARGTPGASAPRLWSEPAGPLDCNSTGQAAVDVHWSAPGSNRVALRWERLDGEPWTTGAASGRLNTGKRLLKDVSLYLQDAPEADARSDGKTLATLTFRCRR